MNVRAMLDFVLTCFVDPTFTPWLFSRAAAIASGTATIPPAASVAVETPVEAMDVQPEVRPTNAATALETKPVTETWQPSSGSSLSRDQVMRDGRQDGMNGRHMQMDRSMGGPSNHPGAFQPGPNFARGRGHGRGRGGHHALNAREFMTDPSSAVD